MTRGAQGTQATPRPSGPSEAPSPRAKKKWTLSSTLPRLPPDVENLDPKLNIYLVRGYTTTHAGLTHEPHHEEVLREVIAPTEEEACRKAEHTPYAVVMTAEAVMMVGMVTKSGRYLLLHETPTSLG